MIPYAFAHEYGASFRPHRGGMDMLPTSSACGSITQVMAVSFAPRGPQRDLLRPSYRLPVARALSGQYARCLPSLADGLLPRPPLPPRCHMAPHPSQLCARRSGAGSACISGYSGQKRVKGRERHLLVDTLGLPVSNYATPADTHDEVGAGSPRRAWGRYNERKITYPFSQEFAQYLALPIHDGRIEYATMHRIRYRSG